MIYYKLLLFYVILAYRLLVVMEKKISVSRPNEFRIPYDLLHVFSTSFKFFKTRGLKM
jgi:hypothetical protein